MDYHAHMHPVAGGAAGTGSTLSTGTTSTSNKRASVISTASTKQQQQQRQPHHHGSGIVHKFEVSLLALLLSSAASSLHACMLTGSLRVNPYVPGPEN